MTSYVQTGEEDLGLELARLIDTLHAPPAATTSSKDPQEETKEQPAEDNETPSMKYVINADYPALYTTGFFSSTAVQHIQSLDASTYDALFTLSFAILDRIEDERKQTEIVRKLVDLITAPAESSTHSSIKLRLLVNLFNQFYANEQALEEVPSKESKVIHSDITMDLLYRALQFAVTTKQYASVQPQLAKHIPEWFGTSASPSVDETPAAPSETQSEIYLLTYQIYQHAAENATLAQQRQSFSSEADNFLYLYLQSLNHATSQQSIQQGLEYARAAALRSISQPLSSTISVGGAKAKAITNAASNTVRVRPLDSQRLLQLTVVQQLSSDKKNPTNAQLYQLLQTVAIANVQQYQELTKQHPQLLQSVGLNAEAILSKLRTLALCQMGLNQTSVQIERVRQELNLQGDVEVEEAVIAAIVSGRLDAKIDEEQGLIKIKRVTGVNRWAAAAQKQQESKQADSEEMQWSSLSSKLQSWRTNVTAVLNTMHASTGHFAPELEASAEE